MQSKITVCCKLSASALALLLSFIGSGLAILPGIKCYGPSSDHADRIRHIYYIAVLISDSLLDDGHESIVYVCVLDGRSLEVWDVTVLLTPCFHLFSGYLPVIFIALITHNNKRKVFWLSRSGVINEALSPLLNGLK